MSSSYSDPGGKAAWFPMSWLLNFLEIQILICCNGYRKRKMVLFGNKSKKMTFKILMSLREEISVLYCSEGCVSAWYPVFSSVIIS